MNHWENTPEEGLYDLGTYTVHDVDVPNFVEGRAAQTLPRNLELKPSQMGAGTGVFAGDIVPRGTVFGPYQGRRYNAGEFPHGQEKSYLWRVFAQPHKRALKFFVDGKDTGVANWMRYIQPGYHSNKQNLVAFQKEEDIFFLTIRHVHPGEELNVWYCREFAARMDYPHRGEILVQELHKAEKTLEMQKEVAMENIRQLSARQAEITALKNTLTPGALQGSERLSEINAFHVTSTPPTVPRNRNRSPSMYSSPESQNHSNKGSPGTPDSGLVNSPQDSGSPPSTTRASTSPDPLNLSKDAISETTRQVDQNSFLFHKLKMQRKTHHHSSHSGSSSGGSSPAHHRATPSPSGSGSVGSSVASVTATTHTTQPSQATPPAHMSLAVHKANERLMERPPAGYPRPKTASPPAPLQRATPYTIPQRNVDLGRQPGPKLPSGFNREELDRIIKQREQLNRAQQGPPPHLVQGNCAPRPMLPQNLPQHPPHFMVNSIRGIIDAAKEHSRLPTQRGTTHPYLPPQHAAARFQLPRGLLPVVSSAAQPTPLSRLFPNQPPPPPMANPPPASVAASQAYRAATLLTRPPIYHPPHPANTNLTAPPASMRLPLPPATTGKAPPPPEVNPGETDSRGYKSLPYPLQKKDGKIEYKCEHCGKVFGQLSNLKVHLRTHSGERPFKCNSCSKTFTQLAHLQKHNLVHTGERPHACPECGKRFSSTSNLKTHLRLHSGTKPYGCEKCSARFTQYVHLKLHKRLHTNERPFTCSFCNKSYISASGLRTHWKTTDCKPTEEEVKATNERALIALQFPIPEHAHFEQHHEDHDQKPIIDAHGSPHYHPVHADHRGQHEHQGHLQPPRLPAVAGRSALDHLHDVVKSEIESSAHDERPLSMTDERAADMDGDESADVDVDHHDEVDEHHHEDYDSEEEEEDEDEVPRHRQVVVTPLLDHVKLANDVMNDANAAKIECPAPGQAAVGAAASSAVTSTSSSEAAEANKKAKSNGISCQ